MLDLEGIVVRWKHVAEAVPVNRHPTVWVAHYGTTDDMLYRRITEGPQARTTELLGAAAVARPNNIGNAVLFLAAPWQTVAQIRETVIVVDISHRLHITHFVDTGASERSTDWRVPYSIGDDGTIGFGLAERLPSVVWEECQILWECRPAGRGSLSFDEAFHASMQLGSEWL